MPYRGVIYCAIQSRLYLEAAVISAFALRQLEPELPIILVTDLEGVNAQTLKSFEITVKRVEIPQRWRSPDGLESRLVKTSLPDFTDFEQTLYIDADVLPIKPVSSIWQYLDQANLALALARQQTIGQCDHVSAVEKTFTLTQCPADSPHFNAGVLLWQRCSTVLNLFQTWKSEWMRFKQQDQLALTRAIQATQLPVVQLADIYNFPAYRVTKEVIQRNEVSLLHCLGGYVKAGRFKLIAQRLMPDSTHLALKTLHGESKAEFEVEE